MHQTKVTPLAAWPSPSADDSSPEVTSSISVTGELPLSADELPNRQPGDDLEDLLQRQVDFLRDFSGCDPYSARLVAAHTTNLTDIVIALFLNDRCTEVARDPWIASACAHAANSFWTVAMAARRILGGEYNEALARRSVQLSHGDVGGAVRLLGRYVRSIPEDLQVALQRGSTASPVSPDPTNDQECGGTREFALLGAHLVVARTGYTHHGIYVGGGMVVHYSGLADGLQAGPVEEVDVETFAGGSDVLIVEHPKSKYPPEEIARRARSRLGEALYSVTANNCEHFCNWCIDNNHHSTQVDLGTAGSSAVSSTAVGLAARGIVSASGAVVGTSGAGVMSGLASVGGVVGGGAVAGVGVAAGLPALAMASLINNTVLADNPALSDEERGARSLGRKATYVGAAGGVAGSIATISAAGTTAGLSGAGIASGLAAIGGTVGGGMTAGVVIATAAPVAAAAAVGVGLYKIVKWIKD